MKITLDTNILVSSILWETSVAHKLVALLRVKNIKIYTSKEILEEFANVLARDFEKSIDEIEENLNFILEFTETIEPLSKLDIIKEDPADNKVLECALESTSNYIISYDKHLLKLNQFENIKIMTPKEALKIV